MTGFDFPLFPFDSTAITVTTTVWIGVCVAVFFNLRLGWTLSGLVVPGYLVPLMMTRPITAVVILLEAMLTYGIVVAISEWPRKLPYWSSLFGRDRFFAILVVSVLVRAVLDGWLLPIAGQFVVEEYGLNFDYRNNLHSFGLIVVALIANYYWKPGVIRGTLPLLTCIALTFVVVKYLLVGLTNFNVGNFHLIYEDLSTSLLASPKAYIIILMTALMASYFNLRYAWDFNGILIPALLGLLWHEPFKILMSGVECVVILTVATLLLKTTYFQKITIEGGRKLCFFFTICFVFRLLLSHILPIVSPGIVLTETFGLGYLLSTLMAVKAHDKQFVVRMIRCITEVSMLGAVTGSLIGFAFFCGPEIRFDWSIAHPVALKHQQSDVLIFTDRPLIEILRLDKVQLYEKRQPESYQPPVPSELNKFHSALKDLATAIDTNLQSPNKSNLDRTLKTLAQRVLAINYQMTVVENRYVYLREFAPAHGWGSYIVDLKRPGNLAIEVPAPLDEWATIESGLCLFQRFPSCGLAIAGAPRKINLAGSADVTKSRETMFAEFHKVFGQVNPLQIRGFETSNSPSTERYISGKSQLRVRGSLPNDLKLKLLKELAGSFDVVWSTSPERNQLRNNSKGDFAELVLTESDRLRLISKLYVPIENDIENGKPAIQSNHRKYHTEIVRENFSDWMLRDKANICQQGSNLYQPAMLEQMLFMDHEVLTPLVKLLTEMPTEFDPEGAAPYWENPEIKSRMLPIQAAAGAINYRLAIVVDPQTDETYVALFEIANSEHRQKGWGTYVFRPGLADAFAVEVPRPLFERRSFEFGINLFERPRASALLIAGAHPRANLDGSADISKVANKTNLFNLVRHVLLRQLGDRPFLMTQARAIQAPVEADIVLATDDGTVSSDALTPLKKQLLDQLQSDRLEIAFVDGRYDTAGYELGILMQATAVQVSQNKEVVSLWLSPSLRTRFREQSDNLAMASQFEACNLPSIEAGLIDYLTTNNSWAASQNVVNVPPDLKSELKRFVDSLDVVQLMKIKQNYTDWRFLRLVDGESGQAFLLISQTPDQRPTVMNLTGYISDQACQMRETDPKVINEFIRARALWLEPAETAPVAEFVSHSPGSHEHQSSEQHAAAKIVLEAPLQ